LGETARPGGVLLIGSVELPRGGRLSNRGLAVHPPRRAVMRPMVSLAADSLGWRRSGTHHAHAEGDNGGCDHRAFA